MTDEHQKKQLHAYNVMRETLKKALHEAEEKTPEALKQAFEKAEEKASELGELTREEIEKLGEWLRRDFHEAAEAWEKNKQELATWWEMDKDLIEAQLLDWVARMADPTIVQWELLREQIHFGEWHTGEITGPGVLICKNCGEKLTFDKPGHIPPCPKCHGSVFEKVYE